MFSERRFRLHQVKLASKLFGSPSNSSLQTAYMDGDPSTLSALTPHVSALSAIFSQVSGLLLTLEENTIHRTLLTLRYAKYMNVTQWHL